MKPPSFSLHETPMKKMMMNSLGNTLRKLSKEDSENKKTPILNGDRSKRNEKINKIIEKSNEFVTDIIAKKNNDQILKRIAPKPNIANISLFSSDIFRKKVKESPAVAPSPIKNIRTVSKKK